VSSIEAQLALIDTKMVSIEQVFLSYAITPDGSTVFEKIISSKLLLGAGKVNQ
jgi:hypothetical protein